MKAAAIQVGKAVLEVAGGDDGYQYWLNGQQGTNLIDGESFLLSRFHVKFKVAGPKKYRFRIDLGSGVAVSVEIYKSFVGVKVKATAPEEFSHVMGLMGMYPNGDKVARDGVTLMEDPNAFGQEWKVKEHDPLLFHSPGVDIFDSCPMPYDGGKQMKRNLRETQITTEVAEKACQNVDVASFDFCVMDVLATNDVNLAFAYTE